MPRYKTEIEFEAPHEASRQEIRDFIKDWLQSGGGCRDPRDPLFHSLSNVKVGKLNLIARRNTEDD